jgi:excisionase family DNA binding protein
MLTRDMAQMVSIAYAAKHLAVSQLTIRRMIAAGKITGYRVGPRLIRIDLEELDQVAHQIPAAGE